MKRFLVYDAKEFRNYLIQEVLKGWSKNPAKKELSENLMSQYPHNFYTPNIFLRLALAVFSYILGVSAISFGAFVIFSAGNFNDIEIPAAFFSFACCVSLVFILESYLKSKKMYRGGVDDMLLYMAYSAFMTGIVFILSETNAGSTQSALVFLFFSALLLSFACIRYVDMLAAFCAYGSLVGIVFVSLNSIGSWGTALLPFVGAGIGVGTYFIVTRVRKNPEFLIWDSLAWIIEITSLLLTYASLNYFVVRTLTEDLLGVYFEEGQDIPMAWLFYSTTAILPFIYLYLGIKNKNRILFRISLCILALSAVTFKIYFSTGHHEITLTLSGALILLVCWAIHTWLKSDKAGLTMKEELEESSYFDAESLVIVNNFQIPNHGNIQTDTDKFGGGGFGGGGSSDTY
jgi:hypothetical protein